MRSIVMIPLLSLVASTAMARTFFVGSYGGSILTVNLDNSTGVPTLAYNNTQSKPGPSWNELSSSREFLYTVEENVSTNPTVGAVSSYSINAATGELTKVSSANGLVRPVSLAISPDQKTIFTASYSSSGVSAYSTDPKTGTVTHLKDWTYKLAAPGKVPERQDVPHPHQALFHPSGKFVLVPDLGADLVRIYSITGPTSFAESTSISTPAGTGPRHGVFFPATGTPTHFYLIGEVANTVLVYTVAESYGQLVFTLQQTVSTLATPTTPPPTTTTTPAPWTTPSAAELAVAPGGSHIYVANRNDKVFTSGTHSIAMYERCADSGNLTTIGHFDSGVKTPRHVSLDPSGTWFVAEGQDSHDLKVYKRDAATGKLEAGPKGTLSVPGGPVVISWYN